MTLRQHLAAMMRLRPPVYRALLDDLTRTLHATALDQILRPGARLVDFALPDTQGNIVTSDALLARGPLAIVLFRGDWCPFCTETLLALDRVLPEISAAGASLVALTFDTGDYAAEDRAGLGLHFPVLCDADGGLALAFGAMFRVPDGLRAYYEQTGIELGIRHGSAMWFLPIPATFLVDPSGIVRHVHASGDVTDRMEPQDIVAQLRALAAPAAP